MALVTLTVFCGCGARFAKIAEGIQHGVETSHKMTIAGFIDPKAQNLETAVKETLSATK